VERFVAVALGTLLCFALLEGGLRLMGFEMRSVQRARNAAAMKAEGAARVLCVGESTTALGGDSAYPAQLEQVLQERRPDREFRVINVGVGGADTALLVSQLPRNLELYRPHLVVAMMGFNDTVGTRAPGVPQWDQTLPDIGMALEDRKGFPYSLKTYRLAELLWFSVARELDDGTGADLASSPDLPVGPPPVQLSAPPAGVVEGPHRYYVDLGRPELLTDARRAAARGDREGAEALFREATRDEAIAVRALVEWGAFLEGTGDLEGAEARFEDALQRDPAAGFALFGRGRIAAERGDCPGAAALFSRAAAADPRCGHGHVAAGLCYLEAGDEERAHAAFTDALLFKRALVPVLQHYDEAVAYARFYRVEGHSGEVFDMLAQFEGGNPQDENGFVVRINLFEALGREDRIDFLATQVQQSPPSDIVALRLAQHYRDRGDEVQATRFLTLARAAQGAETSPMTRESYATMQELLSQHGIPLIAVQYANRPVAPLQSMIEWHDDVVFVDNEAVFREALAEHGYDALFWDHCFGDLGHGTALGNRILAENVATTVLQVVDSMD